MKPSVARLPLSAAVLAVSALFALPAFAQTPSVVPTPAGEPAPGRYQFQPVEGGLARLDTATGEIRICRVDPVRMECDPAPPARSPEALAPRASAEGRDDAEFERALGRMKRVFRAFGDIARDFEAETPPAAAAPDRT